MYLTSSLDKMMKEIKSRHSDYGEDDYITFGILIVDQRQSDAREYIINFFPYFDRRSADYINFYIPGFRKGMIPNHHLYEIRGLNYYFDEKLFIDFCHEFFDRFKIRYTFNPMLILTTMQIKNINTAEFVVIELDDNDSNSVRRAGMLFDEIFKTARYTPDLRNIQKHLMKTQIKNHLLKLIVSSFNSDCLTEIAETGKEIARYRIRC